MASGVKVSDEAKQLFGDMKVVKSDSNQEERLRIVLFCIKDGFVVLKKSYTEKDLEGEDVFKYFKALLEPKECFYMLYDCHYETKEALKKEELIMATWCPTEAPIKDKMCYTSSKGAVKQAFKGIKHDWQLNDYSDVESPLCFEEKLGRKISKLEGKDIHV